MRHLTFLSESSSKKSMNRLVEEIAAIASAQEKNSSGSVLKSVFILLENWRFVFKNFQKVFLEIMEVHRVSLAKQ